MSMKYIIFYLMKTVQDIPLFHKVDICCTFLWTIIWLITLAMNDFVDSSN